MAMHGEIHDGDWEVDVATSRRDDGRFACLIRVAHRLQDATFKREFQHTETFANERDAMVAGLREGMIWIELKRCRTFDV
jgi:hypothetical protein